MRGRIVGEFWVETGGRASSALSKIEVASPRKTLNYLEARICTVLKRSFCFGVKARTVDPIGNSRRCEIFSRDEVDERREKKNITRSVFQLNYCNLVRYLFKVTNVLPSRRGNYVDAVRHNHFSHLNAE